MKQKFELDVSVWTVVKIFAVLLMFYILYLIKDVIAIFFVILFLVAIFSPIVGSWAKKIGRIPAVIAIILIIVAFVAFAIYLIFPPLVIQTLQLSETLPIYIEKYSYLKVYQPQIEKGLESLTGSLTSTAGDVGQGIITLTSGVFGGIVTFITAFVLFIYLLLDDRALKTFVISLFPTNHRISMTEVLRKISNKLGYWFRGQIIVSASIGVIYLIALSIIGVPYTLTLATIAALLDFIPIIGPIIAGTIAGLTALTDSPIKALITVAVFIGVQQLENSIIVPKVMQKAVGLSPVIIIMALLVGAKLFGIAGAILAVPVSASISVIIQEWPIISKTMEKDA